MEGPAEFVDGKIFIGLMLNVLLFGINITQTYFYYLYSKKDRLWIKIFVVVVFLLDFIQPLFCFLFLYRALVVHFGDVAQLYPANNLFAVVPTVTGITACIIQIFFAWRIKILTQNWFYFASVVAFATSGGVCAIVIAYEGNITPRFIDFRRFKIVGIICFASEMIADIMITTILVGYLHKHRTGFRSSDRMVDRIIRVTIQTGLMTLIFSVLDVIFYLISPGGTHLLLNFVLSKLYSTSFLSILNSREGWGYDVPGTGDQLDLSFDLGMRFTSNSTRITELDVDTTPENRSAEQDQVSVTHANSDPERALKKSLT